MLARSVNSNYEEIARRRSKLTKMLLLGLRSRTVPHAMCTAPILDYPQLLQQQNTLSSVWMNLLPCFLRHSRKSVKPLGLELSGGLEKLSKICKHQRDTTFCTKLTEEEDISKIHPTTPKCFLSEDGHR